LERLRLFGKANSHPFAFYIIKFTSPESTVATSGRDGCKLVAVFEVKKEIPPDAQRIGRPNEPQGKTGGNEHPGTSVPPGITSKGELS
jgi:hypothetical protein